MSESLLWDPCNLPEQHRRVSRAGSLLRRAGLARPLTPGIAHLRTDIEDKVSANSRLAHCGDNDPVSPVLLKIFFFNFYKTHLFFHNKILKYFCTSCITSRHGRKRCCHM